MYALHDLVLEIESDGSKREDVHRLLEELTWAPIAEHGRARNLRLSVRKHDDCPQILPYGREVLRTADFRGYERGGDYVLTDGASEFHLRPHAGEAQALLAADFFSKPVRTQANFWCFGLLKLLRPLGFYSLHAAAVATANGDGLLLVGPSGSAKSTLAIALIRAGWRYLSDDAVLLRKRGDRVEALAGRRSFYVDAACVADYADCRPDGMEPDAGGGQRARLRLDESYGEQYAGQCFPDILVFPKIEAAPRSTLEPIARTDALRLLLMQSAPQLFDRRTMAAHLGLLSDLTGQADSFRLDAGADLRDDPAKLIELIREARER